jgi:flavin-dependent dehydrogenase
MKTYVHHAPLNGRVELHTLRQGYCGLAEVDDGMTTVCCWVKAKAFRQAGGTPDRLLAQALQENPYLYSRLRRAKRADVPWITVAYAPRSAPAPIEDGLWKVGDSVAMIAPLTGDGMGMGMQAAEQAATLLLAAFRRDLSWAEASVEYERSWHQNFMSRVRWGRRLETILRHARLASVACLALKAMPALMNTVYRRTRDLPTPVIKDASDRMRRVALEPAPRVAADGTIHDTTSQ